MRSDPKVSSPPHDSGLSQNDKFQQLARELEADEDEAAFEEKVRRVVAAPKPDDANENP